MSVLTNIERSPAKYQEAAVLAREAGEEMLSRLDWMTLKPTVILEIGCRTGEMSAKLKEKYPEAHILAADLSEAMLQYAKAAHPALSYLCATAKSLPLKAKSVDVIFINLLLPWYPQLPVLLRECKRLLKPEGVILLNGLGPDTLKEYHATLSKDMLPILVDMHDVGDLLLQEGFAEPVLDVNYYTFTYRDKNRLVNELLLTGLASDTAQPILVDLPPHAEGTWSFTCEVFNAHAFQPAQDHASMNSEGVAHVPLAQLRQQLKAK